MWSRPVRTREGNIVMARPHIATFSGRHNACKSKVLIVLSINRDMSLAELAEASGVNYKYLSSRLARWVEWHYLLRKEKGSGNRVVYCYSLAARGKRFVENRIPQDRLKD